MSNTAWGQGSDAWVAPGLLALLAVPVLAIVASAASAGLQAAAWADLLADPRLGGAVTMTLWTGTASTLLAWLLTRAILARCDVGAAGTVWHWLHRRLAWMLSVPHAAFAIGLAFLLAPSGWLIRALSPWATGWTSPPLWTTTQDPWGLSLILALCLKETPFLLWAAATQLERDDSVKRLRCDLSVARTLGYPARQAFLAVGWPPLARRLQAPLLAVWVYSLTQVDMALVIGPVSQPTLAALTWQWLQDADPSVQAQGAAGAWLLALLVGLATAALALSRALVQRHAARRGPDGHRASHRPGLSARYGMPRHWPGLLLWAVFVTALLALALSSVAGVWPFPAFWPHSLSGAAWQSVASSGQTLGATASLAVTSSLIALVWCVAWLEWAPPTWDRAIRPLVYASLWLPGVLWVVGLHGLALRSGTDGTWLGVWLAHVLCATPYVLIALSPAYLGFDPRARAVAASLGRSRLAFLWRVKWPLLRPAWLSAVAVGFAVSVAQYLPTLYVGAGRVTTVTTEAIAQASGGQRAVAAAYAALQAILPLLAFAVAARLSRPRFGRPAGPDAGRRRTAPWMALR